MMIKFLFISLLFQSLNALAIEPPVQVGHVKAQLVSEHVSVQPGTPFHLAVRLENDPHWHTYWKVSGDSGKPTTLKWSVPNGINAGAIQWPTPDRLPAPPLVNYGFDEEAFLIVPFDIPSNYSDSSVTLSVLAKWLVCKEICLPGKTTLKITLPISKNSPKPHPVWSGEFQKIRDESPKSPPADWSISAREGSDEFQLWIQSQSAEFDTNPLFKNLTFFPLESDLIKPSGNPILEVTKHQVFARIPKSEYFEKSPQILSLVVTGKDGVGSTQKKMSYVIQAPLSQGTSLWKALLFALIGGILLNLMPCVFPILSIKVLSFVRKASESQGSTFKYGLFYTLGALVTFWILSAALIALRSLGQELGWGFQLQSPYFIAGLSLLFYLMALSLFGMIEFGQRLMGLGQNLTTQEGIRGSFFTGALAVIVATPCTAPFMGTAIGYALSQSNQAAFGVFTALGLGMSLPYLILTSSPSLAKKLPRPGAWMETFKKWMGVPLLATVIWLLWIFEVQTGISGLIAMIASLVILTIGVILSKKNKLIFYIALILSLGVAAFGSKNKASIDVSSKTGAIQWIPLDETQIKTLRSQGKTVLINFTAAWCVSCKVNERVAFASSEFQQWIQGKDLVFMKADWTHQDPNISQFLKRLGRSGVPVYAVYRNNSSAPPELLPELITAQTLIDALK